FAILIAFYAITLPAIGAPISPRDFLPLMPLAAILVAQSMTRVRSFVAVCAVFVIALFYYAGGFAHRTAWHTTMVQQALRLTRPGERIMDVKGETIFRQRP